MKRTKRARQDVSRSILIVDDHPMMRHGMAEFIAREADLAVCGEADSAAGALAMIPKLLPNLVIADLTMPGEHGLELIKDLRVRHPEVAVLVVSMHDESLYAERALRAGARGYLMKKAGGQELLRAIRRVLDGRVYLSEAMADLAAEVLSGRRTRAGEATLRALTDREFDVFQLLGQGLTTQELGARLHMSGKTVETHRLHLREKLHLRSAPELIKYAVRWVGSREVF